MSGRTKLCPNGHVMDASWDRCPYCPSPAAMKAPVPPTRVAGGPPAAPPPPPPPPRPAAPPPMPTPVPPPSRKKDFKKTRLIAEDKKLPVAGWLVALTGKHKGEDFRIREGKNTVGSTPDSSIVITDDYISTKHANINCIMQEGERIFILVDLDSTNGTFLNDSDEPISKEELVDNDTIIFGQTKFKFKCL